MRFLSSLGGKDLGGVVRKVLVAVAGYEVWQHFSVHGKKGKHPLKTMNIYRVMLCKKFKILVY